MHMNYKQQMKMFLILKQRLITANQKLTEMEKKHGTISHTDVAQAKEEENKAKLDYDMFMNRMRQIKEQGQYQYQYHLSLSKHSSKPISSSSSSSTSTSSSKCPTKNFPTPPIRHSNLDLITHPDYINNVILQYDVDIMKPLSSQPLSKVSLLPTDIYNQVRALQSQMLSSTQKTPLSNTSALPFAPSIGLSSSLTHSQSKVSSAKKHGHKRSIRECYSVSNGIDRSVDVLPPLSNVPCKKPKLTRGGGGGTTVASFFLCHFIKYTPSFFFCFIV
ncbi:hypothetical protein RFI_20802 [Reticulomyxa filosa]|uniref:Uncharacterized protein n=1 Tax=Reticulomyxa filosa TaxID=46433 RepID=X6MSW2_RETFI|nr:hypothetical protein RFI_20802 [Reticulomyxa filosa]|eukprot:ETO16537.1 hypothetical protein RFI_20802 [Reticulomyxa filosa]